MSRVLVVEDEAHLAKGLRFNLEAEGHSWKLLATANPRSSASWPRTKILMWSCST